MTRLHQHRPRSMRMKGHDYREPGDYFVTICTFERNCLFGSIEKGRMLLSQCGAVAKEKWEEIPAHFAQVRLGRFQIMPNHVHGIFSIVESLQGRSMLRPPRGSEKTEHPRVLAGSLSAIVRSYKSAVTKACHEQGLHTNRPIWQSRFHDRIIRDDVSYFFIDRYIELNPLVWQFDPDNPFDKEKGFAKSSTF